MTANIDCPTCRSENVVFSRKRDRHVCEDCGHEFVAEKPVVRLRIFLSYGHDSNEDLVRRIKADLEKRGHDVWFDKSEIKFGDDWRRSITEGITGSHKFVSFLSKHSTRDPGVCLDEIGIAIGVKEGNIQTILVESEQEVKPPPGISHTQWLDMHDWKERRAAGQAAWENWYQDKFAEIVCVVESDESRRFAGEIETLKNHLKPIKSDSRIYELLKKGLTGRQWLFEAVEKWRTSDRASRVFWLMGAPGVGKSAVAAHLAIHGREVIAVEFCNWQQPGHKNPEQIVRTLAFQIATRLPDYRKLLLTLAQIAELDRKNAAELFDYLLADPLHHAIDGSRERYLIVIDALDEAGEAGRNPLVEMLARHAPRLPDWIGLVVTSRPESNVIAPLQSLNPFPFETSSEKNLADIRDYLRHELASKLQGRADADRLVTLILENSEGVFLYVERFCDDIGRGHLSLDRPEQFPQGLGGIFFQYFQRQFPDLEEFRKDVRPALRAILAAREPLPVEILQRLFNWQDEELRDFTRSLGSLFPVTTEAGHEVIKPYHKSLADWLADRVRSNDNDFWISLTAGGKMLTDFCVMAARATDLVPVGYVKRHAAAHLLAEQRWEELGESIFSSRLELLDRWTARGEQVEGEACLRGVIDDQVNRGHLHRAAELSTQLARVLTQLGSHAEAEARLRQALRWASGPDKHSTHSIVWHELGSLLYYQGRHREAAGCYHRALRLAKQASPVNHAEAAANLVGLATIARTLQQHTDAIELSREGIAQAESCGDVRHVVAARRILANSLRCQMQMIDARNELAAARMLCVLHDFPFDQTAITLSQAWLAYEQAIIDGANGDAADAAEPLFHAALEQGRRVKHLVSQVEAPLGLTWCAFVRHDPIAASHWFDEAATVASAEEYQELAVALAVGRATLTLLQGDLPNAERLYTTARGFCCDVGQVAWQADSCVGLAAVHHHQGRTKLSRIAEREALQLARRCGALKVRLVQLGLDQVKANPSAVPY